MDSLWANFFPACKLDQAEHEYILGCFKFAGHTAKQLRLNTSE